MVALLRVFAQLLCLIAFWLGTCPMLGSGAIAYAGGGRTVWFFGGGSCVSAAALLLFPSDFLSTPRTERWEGVYALYFLVVFCFTVRLGYAAAC